jgi:two-component system, cell cycle response regulator DivK
MLTILVAEDHEDSRSVLSQLLMIHGYRVLEAEDGSEAIRVATEQHPDLILMDLAMPVQGGFEATGILKGMPETAGIPVIAMSAHLINVDELDGFSAFIEKPIDLDELLQKLREVSEREPPAGSPSRA